MPLNHINLCASDVDALADKLAAYFGYYIADSGVVPSDADATGVGSHFAVAVGEDGSELVITEIDAPAHDHSAYPKGFHFGLIQDSRQAVYDKHEQLADAGLQPGEISDGFEVWGATWTAFYCPLGDGLEIEINYRTSSELLDRSTATAG